MKFPSDKLIPLIFLGFILLNSCSGDTGDAIPAGPYLGQNPPGTEPQLFAPGIVSTGLYNRDIAMTPDGNELYFGVVLGQFQHTTIMVSKVTNGQWSEPEVASFAENPNWLTLEPHISPNGEWFFFFSTRPDTAAGDTTAGDEDIWVMKRTGEGWGPPSNLGSPVNTADEEYFPSATRDGTLYFTRQDQGSPIGYIYRSRFVEGEYTEPEMLPEEVNSGQSQYNAFIAPDESYIIVPTYGREDSYGATDYYISFRDSADNWTESINMGPTVNSASPAEYSAYVSPDGHYLFFMSGRQMPGAQLPELLSRESIQNYFDSPQNGNPNIFWIDAVIIDELRNQIF